MILRRTNNVKAHIPQTNQITNLFVVYDEYLENGHPQKIKINEISRFDCSYLPVFARPYIRFLELKILSVLEDRE